MSSTAATSPAAHTEFLTEVGGYQNQIVNTGTISGSSIAIALTGILGISGASPTSLTNPALDPSRYGIINRGDILGGSIGIYGGGPLKVVNSGLIDAGEFGVLMATDPSDASSLTNSGTIRANMAFQGGIGQDTVINTGRIEGKLDFSLGDDLYDGRGGVVTGTVVLGNGNDTAYGGGAIETLNGGQGDDLLYGNGGDDYLDGGDGTDILNGGAGDDVMTGGTGDDTYVVDTVGDVVTEGNDAGIDYRRGCDLVHARGRRRKSCSHGNWKPHRRRQRTRQRHYG